ncbi:MAG: D-aminoacyl-tRNA deacylase [Pseudomonadota bacterium]
MIGLIQRVSSASVVVDGDTIGAIDRGLLVLVGVEKGDSAENVAKLADRVANYRVFSDSVGKMNLSVTDINAAILAVPQFTLAADTRRGRRPSFSGSADPKTGKTLFDQWCGVIRERGLAIETGRFGADMQVSLVNDGPVTFWLTA